MGGREGGQKNVDEQEKIFVRQLPNEYTMTSMLSKNNIQYRYS